MNYHIVFSILKYQIALSLLKLPCCIFNLKMLYLISPSASMSFYTTIASNRYQFKNLAVLEFQLLTRHVRRNLKINYVKIMCIKGDQCTIW